MQNKLILRMLILKSSANCFFVSRGTRRKGTGICIVIRFRIKAAGIWISWGVWKICKLSEICSFEVFCWVKIFRLNYRKVPEFCIQLWSGPIKRVFFYAECFFLRINNDVLGIKVQNRNNTWQNQQISISDTTCEALLILQESKDIKKCFFLGKFSNKDSIPCVWVKKTIHIKNLDRGYSKHFNNEKFMRLQSSLLRMLLGRQKTSHIFENIPTWSCNKTIFLKNSFSLKKSLMKVVKTLLYNSTNKSIQ